MNEALSSQPAAAPQGDALAPQSGPTVPVQTQTPLSEQKPEKTDSERRSESVRKAIEKAQADKPDDTGKGDDGKERRTRPSPLRKI